MMMPNVNKVHCDLSRRVTEESVGGVLLWQVFKALSSSSLKRAHRAWNYVGQKLIVLKAKPFVM